MCILILPFSHSLCISPLLSHSNPLGGGWSRSWLHPPTINTWHALRPTPLEKKSHSFSFSITNLSISLCGCLSLCSKVVCVWTLFESQSSMAMAMAPSPASISLVSKAWWIGPFNPVSGKNPSHSRVCLYIISSLRLSVCLRMCWQPSSLRIMDLEAFKKQRHSHGSE